MGVPFCPDSRHWETARDETITVSELLESSGWNGENLTVVGSQPDDYNGASQLFKVSMTRDLAVKFFGGCRIFSAVLSPHDGIRVSDGEHLIRWAKENGISSMDDLRARFHEYTRLFPSNCIRDTDGSIRISVY